MCTPVAEATGRGEKLRRRARLRGTSGGRVALVVSEAEPLAGEDAAVDVAAVDVAAVDVVAVDLAAVDAAVLEARALEVVAVLLDDVEPWEEAPPHAASSSEDTTAIAGPARIGPA